MAFAGWLAFVMLIGAAKADASPEQAVLLRDAVQPLIDDMRSGGSPMPTDPRYPAGHGWTPTGRFGPVRCKVLLARYSCPYPREEHDPNLPPEDVDFSGRRRPRDPQAPHDHRESIAGCFRCDLRREETTDAEA